MQELNEELWSLGVADGMICVSLSSLLTLTFSVLIIYFPLLLLDKWHDNFWIPVLAIGAYPILLAIASAANLLFKYLKW